MYRFCPGSADQRWILKLAATDAAGPYIMQQSYVIHSPYSHVIQIFCHYVTKYVVIGSRWSSICRTGHIQTPSCSKSSKGHVFHFEPTPNFFALDSKSPLATSVNDMESFPGHHQELQAGNNAVNTELPSIRVLFGSEPWCAGFPREPDLQDGRPGRSTRPEGTSLFSSRVQRIRPQPYMVPSSASHACSSSMPLYHKESSPHFMLQRSPTGNFVTELSKPRNSLMYTTLPDRKSRSFDALSPGHFTSVDMHYLYPRRYTFPADITQRDESCTTLPRPMACPQVLHTEQHAQHGSTATLATEPEPMKPTSEQQDRTNADTQAQSGRRFSCERCGKRFSRPSSVRIHMHSHTGEKPFMCPEPNCGRVFSVLSNLRRHQKSHSSYTQHSAK
mgnify:CR=1 FL=1